jgi:hypothetical protein
VVQQFDARTSESGTSRICRPKRPRPWIWNQRVGVWCGSHTQPNCPIPDRTGATAEFSHKYPRADIQRRRVAFVDRRGDKSARAPPGEILRSAEVAHPFRSDVFPLARAQLRPMRLIICTVACSMISRLASGVRLRLDRRSAGAMVMPCSYAATTRGSTYERRATAGVLPN